jgi:hypothetical protein
LLEVIPSPREESLPMKGKIEALKRKTALVE